MEDEFTPVVGFPGYRITRDGRVESCWSRHARPARMTGTWLPLRPARRHRGHLTVNLSRDGDKTNRPIHRLVLEAYVGPCPSGLVCCHNNGRPWDNRVENLRWDTPKSNSEDALRHGTRAVGSRCKAKLVETDVIAIRRMWSEGASAAELAGKFGVSGNNIKAIVYRRSWRHLPDDPIRDGPGVPGGRDDRGLRQRGAS